MPTTTITNYQWEGLYELIRNHLGSIGDVWTALEETEVAMSGCVHRAGSRPRRGSTIRS